MVKKRNYSVTTKMPDLPDLNAEDSLLNMFDQNNPDLNLLNLVDDEQIRLSGSKLYYYRYHQSEDFDPVYMESRSKPIALAPLLVHGHYNPVAMSEELTQFGIEQVNDQMFTFNKTYIERKLGRLPIPGDVIKPVFQNQRYEIFEVVEDSFEAYGVYHLVCSARLLRDNQENMPENLTKVPDPIPGPLGDYNV